MKYTDLNLRAEYLNYATLTYPASHEGFVTAMKGKVSNPSKLDRIRWCTSCNYPVDHDGLTAVRGGAGVCSRCLRMYAQCAVCNEWCRDANHVVVDGVRQLMCQGCRGEHFAYCRTCDAWYRHEDADEHRHGADGCCVSPMLEFTFPFQGGTITQDQRVTVGTHPDVLSALGLDEVKEYLRRAARRLPSEERSGKLLRLVGSLNTLVGRALKNESGSFTTRLKRVAYNDYKLKIEPEILTEVGNIVNRHATVAGGYEVAVTRDLNLPSSEFGNTNSCYWTEYAHSRCRLKTNGGIGLRSFDGKQVAGRVWLFPLKKIPGDRIMGATFATDTGMFVVFNGYGNLANQAGPNLVQQMIGAETVVKCPLGADMYINNSSGWFVGPRAAAAKVPPYGLSLVLEEHSTLYDHEKKELTHV